MRTRRRRRVDALILAGGGLAVGACAIAGGVAGDTEHIERMWAGAVLEPDSGSAQITEVIDWDFGATASDRHGIYRIVPGLDPDAPVSTSSPTAPDELVVTTEVDGTRLRIGDPDRTVTGRHRYRIEYPLAGVARAAQTGGDGGEAGGTQELQIDWEAVGTEWDVGMERAEVHLVAPAELTDIACYQGQRGSQDTCDIDQPEPGHLAVSIDGLDPRNGVSIEARVGAPLASAPALPDPPATPPEDPGTGLLPPAGAAAGAALLAAVPVTVAVRRAGRERVVPGGTADAAYAAPPIATPEAVVARQPATAAAGGAARLPDPPERAAGEIRIDHSELAEMATTEFAPPAELTPAEGGIVLTERVQPEHKVAWLIQAAIDGTVEMEEEGGRTVRLRRSVRRTPETAPILDLAFGHRTEIELGSYDRQFAGAWRQLDSLLSHWRTGSGLWDEAADHRKVAARVLGIIAAVAGAVGAAIGGALANRWGPGWLPLGIVGGLLAGAGLAAALGAWELHVRTPWGSGLWLRVESFRRFLAGSEAYHAEQAAQRGVLREYTAWALALGEIDRWSRAVSASTVIPREAGLGYVYMAPLLMSSTRTAATAPRSSGGGGGGFGGGGVGGGAGGGGGGSW